MKYAGRDLPCPERTHGAVARSFCGRRRIASTRDVQRHSDGLRGGVDPRHRYAVPTRLRVGDRPDALTSAERSAWVDLSVCPRGSRRALRAYGTCGASRSSWTLRPGRLPNPARDAGVDLGQGDGVVLELSCAHTVWREAQRSVGGAAKGDEQRQRRNDVGVSKAMPGATNQMNVRLFGALDLQHGCYRAVKRTALIEPRTLDTFVGGKPSGDDGPAAWSRQ